MTPGMYQLIELRLCVARSGVLMTVAEVVVAPAVVVVTCHPRRQRDSGA